VNLQKKLNVLILSRKFSSFFEVFELLFEIGISSPGPEEDSGDLAER
jgi:hypothetical protein